MTEAEKAAVLSIVSGLQPKLDNTHLQDRYRDYHVSAADIVAAIPRGEIIEVSSHHGRDYRVVLRDRTCRPNVVTVLSLVTGTVITAWKNHSRDEHQTLMTDYNWVADLTQLPAYLASRSSL